MQWFKRSPWAGSDKRKMPPVQSICSVFLNRTLSPARCWFALAVYAAERLYRELSEATRDAASRLKSLAIISGVLLLIILCGSIGAWLLVDVLSLPYDRILTRLVLLCVVLSAWPMTRVLNIDWQASGFTQLEPSVIWRSAVLGVLLLLPIMLVHVVTGFRVLDPRLVFDGQLLGFVVFAVLSAFAVGVFEEGLFRGVLLIRIQNWLGTATAVTITSVLYGCVHFLRPKQVSLEAVEWYSGFSYLQASLLNLFDAQANWDSFLALALLGGLFCVVRLRFSLWACVGLHAGFVLGIRLFKEAMVREMENPYQAMVGSYDHFVGLLVAAWIVFLLVCLQLHKTVKDRSSAPHVRL